MSSAANLLEAVSPFAATIKDVDTHSDNKVTLLCPSMLFVGPIA